MNRITLPRVLLKIRVKRVDRVAPNHLPDCWSGGFAAAPVGA